MSGGAKGAARYRRAILYFLSGTGNSYRVAEWMAAELRRAGTEVRLVPIDGADPAEEIEPGAQTLVGLVGPTHGFTAPWRMLRFAMGLPRGRGVHAVCVPTRAGMKLGPLLLPGIAGSGPFLLALILALKGYRVRGAASINMPSNWTSLHTAYYAGAVKAISEASRPLAEAFAARIASGRRVWFTVNNLYELLWGVLLAPISFLYLLIGRFYLAKVFFANSNCNGCGLCAESCPMGAIRMRGGRPFWRHNCESCMRCMAFCPEKAIEASQGWCAMLCYVTLLPVAHMLLRWLGGYLPFAAEIRRHVPGLLIELPYIYLVIFLAYYPLYWLTRTRFFNALFTWTTGTHYYRRYHEPGTRLADLRRGGKDAQSKQFTAARSAEGAVEMPGGMG